MSDVNVTVVGHVGQNPTLFTANSGTRWTSIRVASTRRVLDPRTGEWGDGPTMWFTVRAFGERALNVVESVRKGTPVVVTGRLAFEEFEIRREERGPDGTVQEVSRPGYALVVEKASIAVDLARGCARYLRAVHTDVVPNGAPDAAPQTGAGVAERPALQGFRAGEGAPGGELEDDDDEELAGARETVGVAGP